jgi:hypothetical protein
VNRARLFAAVDVAYLEQDTIMELRDRFGAVGPLVFLALMLDAKSKPKGAVVGVTEGRYAPLARRCATDEVVAQKVLATAAEIGLVELLDCGERRYKVRLVKYDRWEPKDPTAAERQSRRRAKATP